MYKLIKTCNGFYLVTKNYDEDQAHFYHVADNIGMVEVRRYNMSTLNSDCWYAYDFLQANIKAIDHAYNGNIPEKLAVPDVKYCYVVYDKEDSSFCILGNEIDEVNDNLQIFDDYYELINEFPLTFQYN